jgi:hypothetical protein
MEFSKVSSFQNVIKLKYEKKNEVTSFFLVFFWFLENLVNFSFMKREHSNFGEMLHTNQKKKNRNPLR